MNVDTQVYKNLVSMQRASDATLNGSADGLSVIEAMIVGRACLRFSNNVSRIIEDTRGTQIRAHK